jgi:phosphatidylserine decarboxylase
MRSLSTAARMPFSGGLARLVTRLHEGGTASMHDYLIIGAALSLVTALLLGWKWQLGIALVGGYALAGSLLVAIILSAVNPLLRFTSVTGTVAMWGITIAAGLAGLAILSLRDPDRTPPPREDVIVSPADGRVIYVRTTQPGHLPVADKKGIAASLRELEGTTLSKEASVAIGIAMNLSDVHVNRAPIAGRVRLVEHVRGTFGSLRNAENLLTNERVTTIIEDENLQVALVQIASRLVRRIVTFVSEDRVLGLGQRIGAIRFGSQVDLIIPVRQDVRITVQVGDRVVAGRTIAAVITSRV